METKLKSFYKKTVKERKSALKDLNLYDDNFDYKLDDDSFNHLIENYITTYEVPMGVAPDFLIDGKIYHIPMATEEPSVIAGASHAAKIIKRNGGFKVLSLSRLMIGQIIFKDVKKAKDLIDYLETQKDTFKKIAYQAHPQIHKLGGGLIDFRVEDKSQGFVCLYASINTLDAMGANTINTILEAISNYIIVNYPTKILMSILSNLNVNSLVSVRVTIDPRNLKSSSTIHHDIADASTYASLDPYRAATHNKGIMNGVTALMLATGNDTRSIEAAAHSYASITGSYKPLSKWYVEDNLLIGEITIPLALGTVGGSMGILPKVKLSHKILNVSSAKELMFVAASLGLAQNFAALYALTTDGINKGHMRLHARNIALEAGASNENMNDVVEYMLNEKSITLETAKKYINKS
ncbi:hydroxymethylglutaryl-CoA reductase, degradative [Acholeplasma granularum]|uniref:hydroxymethylglutaryl-CoA reductase, degradative n=1 Tax=Acholeplasma granularum TaxID=264635 RepID=UPI0004707BE8|nr:hydroxymethylglutaryl-CoA reductase, degradative [Acholeplasma granularum]